MVNHFLFKSWIEFSTFRIFSSSKQRSFSQVDEENSFFECISLLSLNQTFHSIEKSSLCYEYRKTIERNSFVSFKTNWSRRFFSDLMKDSIYNWKNWRDSSWTNFLHLINFNQIEIEYLLSQKKMKNQEKIFSRFSISFYWHQIFDLIVNFHSFYSIWNEEILDLITEFNSLSLEIRNLLKKVTQLIWWECSNGLTTVRNSWSKWFLRDKKSLQIKRNDERNSMKAQKVFIILFIIAIFLFPFSSPFFRSVLSMSKSKSQMLLQFQT